MAVNRTTAFLGAIFILASGCASPGTLVYRQTGDALPKVGKAPVDGVYALFIAGESQELERVTLKKETPLGFENGSDGIVQWLYAIAGPMRLRLDVRLTYEWRLQP
jgi:hypothetical protein